MPSQVCNKSPCLLCPINQSEIINLRIYFNAVSSLCRKGLGYHFFLRVQMEQMVIFGCMDMFDKEH